MCLYGILSNKNLAHGCREQQQKMKMKNCTTTKCAALKLNLVCSEIVKQRQMQSII